MENTEKQDVMYDRETIYSNLVENGFITDDFTKIIKTFTAEEWFISEEAKEYYECYSNVLADDKHRYENKNTFNNVKFYLAENGMAYKYFEDEYGLKHLTEVNVSFSCVHNGGYDEALLIADIALNIIPRNWGTGKVNYEAFKQGNVILFK